MRRGHRTGHFLIWLLLVPAIAVAAFIALHHMPRPADNESLPAELTEEAG